MAKKEDTEGLKYITDGVKHPDVQASDVLIHVINVGQGDSILVEVGKYM